MNVMITDISEDLNTTVQGVQTAITLFLLVMAALMIPGGKLTDRWGRKRCFTVGLTIYGIGALISALSPNLGVLIIGNSILEGVGTAMLIPPVYILTTLLFRVRPGLYQPGSSALGRARCWRQVRWATRRRPSEVRCEWPSANRRRRCGLSPPWRFRGRYRRRRPTGGSPPTRTEHCLGLFLQLDRRVEIFSFRACGIDCFRVAIERFGERIECIALACERADRECRDFLRERYNLIDLASLVRTLTCVAVREHEQAHGNGNAAERDAKQRGQKSHAVHFVSLGHVHVLHATPKRARESLSLRQRGCFECLVPRPFS